MSPSQFTVGDRTTFEWLYTVDTAGFASGDELRVRDPVFDGMRWSRWGEVTPYTELCTADSGGRKANVGYVTAYATREGERLDDVALDVQRTNCPSGPASCSADLHLDTETVISLASGTLEPGDTIHLVMGDVRGCYRDCEEAGNADCSACDACAFELPHRAFDDIPWTAQYCSAGGTCVDLDPVHVQVQAHRLVHMLHVTAPSRVALGTTFALKVAVLDTFGNPIKSSTERLTVHLAGASGTGDGDTFDLSEAGTGWHDFEVSLADPGVYRLSVTTDGGLVGISNPIEVLATEPEYYIYWGDIHSHHGLTWTDDSGALHDVDFDYARDVAGLDIVSQSEKAAGLEIDEDALWSNLEQMCQDYTEDGRFVVLQGFEWMGDLAAARTGESDGHDNVYYNACDAPYGTLDVDVIGGVIDLWAWIDQEKAAEPGLDAVSIPHAMRFTGCNYEATVSGATAGNPGTQTLAEIYSQWGDSTNWADDPTCSVQDMLAHGLRLGWIAASDDHDGWEGNPLATYGSSPGGLGAFLAPALTRAHVFAAMKNRHTYATTGHRAIVEFQVQDGEATVDQGTEYLARSPVAVWTYHGTAAIKSVHVYAVPMVSDGERVSVAEEGPLDLDASGSVDLEWDGVTPTAYWLEVAQEDYHKAWSSPIYVTADCARMQEGAVDPLGICGPADTGPQTGDTAVDTGATPGETADTAGDTGDGTASGSGGTARTRCSGCGSARGSQAALWLLGLGAITRRRRKA